MIVDFRSKVTDESDPYLSLKSGEPFAHMELRDSSHDPTLHVSFCLSLSLPSPNRTHHILQHPEHNLSVTSTMAGVVVWLIGIAATQAVVHVKNKRSPLIRLPLPPAEDSLAPLSSDFSERDLKRVTRSWRAREQALTARYNAIVSARERGLERCWAGDVVQARVIRRARDEAEWVADKLEEAIRWCRQQGVKKGGIKTLALGKMAERARTSYASTPPTLYELPFPLPVAPDWNDYHLTVNRLEVTGPPAYRYEPDEQGGEKVMERSEMLAGYSERA